MSVSVQYELSSQSSYHANLTMCKREALRTVRKRHRAFAGRVERSKDINEHSDKTEMCWAALRNQETQTSCKQRPCHLWEGEEEQASAPESVDGPDRGPGEDEIDKPEAEGGY